MSVYSVSVDIGIVGGESVCILYNYYPSDNCRAIFCYLEACLYLYTKGDDFIHGYIAVSYTLFTVTNTHEISVMTRLAHYNAVWR